MLNIFKSTMLYFYKIKIIHSIPGRLRVSVPGLELIPHEAKEYETYLSDLIKLKKGIQDISYSYMTNKVLFLYDTSCITDKEIVQWLEIIMKTLMEKEKDLKHLPLKTLELNFSQYYEELKKNLLKKGEIL